MAIDPYRTLGLTAAASLDEVKRAYRRLAKQYHPDAAGDDATRRFLAVQAAYEAIVEGPSGSRGRGAATRQGGAPPPWQADPARARATRDAYRARGAWRAGGGQAGSAAGPARPGSAAGPARAGPGSGGTARPGSAAGPARPGSGTGGTRPGTRSGAGQDPRARRYGPEDGDASGADSHGPRPGASGSSGRSGKRSSTRRKATLTSTSYDEATRGPFEPDWDGGSWYGMSSGTYWTINPKEYADPRKHGPEYQARARRAVSQPDSSPQAPPGPAWTGPTATWAGTSDDPMRATSPAGRADAPDPATSTTSPGGRAARSATSWSGAAWPGERPPPPAEAPPGEQRPATPPARDVGGPSVVVAGLKAAAYAAIPSGAVLILAAIAEGSALATVALVTPAAVGVAAALTARRSRGRPPR